MIRKTFCALFTAFLLVIAICAHPGRTDANGGHWNRETGEYHFHDGRYAGKGSSGISSSEYKPFTPPYDPPTDNPYKTAEQQTKEVFSVVLGAFIITVVSIAAIYFFISNADVGCFSLIVLCICLRFSLSLLDTNAVAFTITVASILLPFIIVCVFRHYYKKSESYLLLYKNAVIEYEDFLYHQDLLSKPPTVPQEYEIGEDGLPKERGVDGWGQSLTFYKSLSGKKLHQKYNCGNATTKVHLVQYCDYRNIKDILCKNCSVQNVPDMQWYNEFLKHQKAQETYAEMLGRSEDMYKALLHSRKKCGSMMFGIWIRFNKEEKATLEELHARCNEIVQRYVIESVMNAGTR